MLLSLIKNILVLQVFLKMLIYLNSFHFNCKEIDSFYYLIYKFFHLIWQGIILILTLVFIDTIMRI